MALFLTGKRKISNQIEDEFWKIGNAQMIGSGTIQSNYFSTIQGEDVFAVLADGTIDHINGRRAAVLAVETCMAEFQKKTELIEIPEFFELLETKMICNINEQIYMGRTPYVSISMVYGNGQHIYYNTIGTNQIFVFNGTDYILLKGKNGMYHKKEADMIGLISEGVYETLDEIELMNVIGQSKSPYKKAQEIREKILEKKKSKRKNATIILVEGRI